jgi:phage terminase large subunit-like protein
MFDDYDVAYLYADPRKWQDELEEWAARWPDRVVELPTNSPRRMSELVDRFRTSLEEDRLTHDGDPDLTRHMLNARLRKVGRDEDGRGRYMLEKAGPGRLIDAAVAGVLACEAASQMATQSSGLLY